jgi:hypothetical protein
MGWFLDTLLGYVMMDVVEVEFQKLKGVLCKEGASAEQPPSKGETNLTSQANQKPVAPLDFTSLRTIHANYLDRLLNGCLLTNPGLTAVLQSILETCEHLAAQVERWGGDVLPALLFEGSLRAGEEGVGAMVKERWAVVADIDEVSAPPKPLGPCAHSMQDIAQSLGVVLRAAECVDIATASLEWA